ncbi:outer membrane beta-barrel protein [Urechidicola croceus]|uniref:Outer membrane protein beta-barrel domain-containing protein n=1 Tax=Urechidicola croceus TaxID=1850246 RepID=A0A1D8P4K6_9FLAO|nr:outer membrane beta-barrel family protein [Urechidicola croceus]AOW19451.1 hypothetical protein LPB138_01565 [Urechidicola croceus]
MKKLLLLTFGLLIYTANLYSQENLPSYTVTGKVIDASNNQELEYATVIFSQRGKSEVIGSVTDKNGNFKIEVPQGKYVISVEFLSYKTKIFKPRDINNNIHFGSIELSEDLESLDEVEIIIEKKDVDLKLDKQIFNVDKSVLSKGGSAIQAITNIPLVNIDNGNIVIRGNSATVLINGKISAMSKTEALENISAESIQRIELITKPSSKYNASATGGIINIITKKGIDNGFNGSTTVTGGIKDIYGTAFSLNYKNDKVNIFTNTSFFQRNPITNTTTNSSYFNNDLLENSAFEKRKYHKKDNVLNTEVGVDFHIDSKTTITPKISYLNISGRHDLFNTVNYYDEFNVLEVINNRTLDTHSQNDVIEFSTNFTKKFEKEGEEIDAFVAYSIDDYSSNSFINNFDTYPTETNYRNLDENVFDDLKIDNLNLKFSYNYPIDETSSLETGYEGEIGTLTNDFSNEVIDTNDSFVVNPNTSGMVNYDQDIHAIYADYYKEFNKISFGGGLRAEKTIFNISMLNTSENVSRDYTEFFPSLYTDFAINDSTSLTLYYSRGIYRPGYFELNPFEQFQSEVYSFKGNSNLDHSIFNGGGISYYTQKNKLTLIPSITFYNYNNLWTDIPFETNEVINNINKITVTPININSTNRFGLDLVLSYQPTDWLSVTNTAEVYNWQTKGIYEYVDVNNNLVRIDNNFNNYSASNKLSSTVKLNDKIKFQATSFYHLPTETSIRRQESYAWVNASINTEVLNGKGSFSIVANDLFNSNRRKQTRLTQNIATGSNIASKTNRQHVERSVLVTFSYRFNQSKKDNKIDFNIKNDEEKF